ncbi:hypothetical protein BJX99DRAFT_225666 [Aspergillus californicus]
MDLLYWVKGAMPGSRARSKRPCRGSGARDESKYDLNGGFCDPQEPKFGGSGLRLGHGAGDHGSRFESDGVRARPGTYDSGDNGSSYCLGAHCYEPNGNGGYFRSGPGSVSQSSSTDIGVRTKSGGAAVAGSNSHNKQNAESNRLSGNEMGLHIS